MPINVDACPSMSSMYSGVVSSASSTGCISGISGFHRLIPEIKALLLACIGVIPFPRPARRWDVANDIFSGVTCLSAAGCSNGDTAMAVAVVAAAIAIVANIRIENRIVLMVCDLISGYKNNNSAKLAKILCKSQT